MKPRPGYPHWVVCGASALGIPVAEYAAHVAAGEAWCTGHKAWEPRALFYRARHRGSGVGTSCRVAHRDYATWRWWRRTAPPVPAAPKLSPQCASGAHDACGRPACECPTCHRCTNTLRYQGRCERRTLYGNTICPSCKGTLRARARAARARQAVAV